MEPSSRVALRSPAPQPRFGFSASARDSNCILSLPGSGLALGGHLLLLRKEKWAVEVGTATDELAFFIAVVDAFQETD